MNYTVKHICLSGFPMVYSCLFRGVINHKGFIYYNVECPICHKVMTVDSTGKIIQ